MTHNMTERNALRALRKRLDESRRRERLQGQLSVLRRALAGQRKPRPQPVTAPILALAGHRAAFAARRQQWLQDAVPLVLASHFGAIHVEGQR